MMNLIKETRHIGISVSDMEKSLKFYQNILGLKVFRVMDESGNYIDNMLSLKNVRVKTVKLSVNSGNTLIELLEFKSHVSKPQTRHIYEIGASHVAFTVENLDVCYDYLSKNGVKFTAPPQFSPDGFAKVTFCYDPDNTPIELVEVLKKQ
jgi:catechol 2,3-dioxygenase-like lactoylglutathione lyase family enzyme